MRRIQQRHRGAYDAVSLLIYQSIVYGWSFAIGPLGKDFAALHRAAEGDGPLLFQLEHDVFGDWVAGYHIVNFVLLFLCTLLVYWVFRCFDKNAPIWLATLAATLFMANPVHAEAMLLLSGSGNLFAAFWGLAAIATYARWFAAPSRLRLMLALLALMGVVIFLPGGLGVFIVIIFHAMMIGPRLKQRPSLVLGIGTVAIHLVAFRWEPFVNSFTDLGSSIAGLYFILYPIGFLPESARQFHDSWWIGWTAAAVVVLLLFLVHRKVNQRLFAFGMVGAVGYAALAHTGRVDPVHLTGGGALLVPTALVSISAVVMFGQMLRHPKWRTIVVLGTTLFAFLFFGLTMQRVAKWRHASDVVATFQEEAAGIYDETGSPVGVLPDYQFYRGAPIQLSESIRYDTSFSAAIPYEVLVKLDYDRPERLDIEADRMSDGAMRVVIAQENVRGLVPWPYDVPNAMVGEHGLEVLTLVPDAMTLRIRVVEGFESERLAPVHSSR